MIVNVYDVINNSDQCKKYLEDKEKQLEPLLKQINEIKDNYNDKINKFLEENLGIKEDLTILKITNNQKTIIGTFKGSDGNNIYLEMLESDIKKFLITFPLNSGTIEIVDKWYYINFHERYIADLKSMFNTLVRVAWYLENPRPYATKEYIDSIIGSQEQHINCVEGKANIHKNFFKIECAYCGEKFLQKSKNQYCCSETCKNKYKFHNKSIIERCEKYGVTKIDDTITLPKVYNKYNGICYICGKKTNIHGSQYDDDYPNVEHVKALYNGGTHTWNNVKLACRACNMIKGTN